MIFPHQFSTILEVDYDTPYDRHVIIEESFDTRNVRRKIPKIEDSFGDRIMRFALQSAEFKGDLYIKLEAKFANLFQEKE